MILNSISFGRSTSEQILVHGLLQVSGRICGCLVGNNIFTQTSDEKSSTIRVEEFPSLLQFRPSYWNILHVLRGNTFIFDDLFLAFLNSIFVYLFKSFETEKDTL